MGPFYEGRMRKKILTGFGLFALLLIGLGRMAWSTTSTVEVERTFKAPVTTVWKLWNDPETIKLWWSPKDYTAPVVKNDLKVGGTYLLSMKSPKGEMFWNVGTYKSIVPNERIISSLSFSDERGKLVPGAQVKVPGRWPDEIVVKVEFKEKDGKTRVSVTEVGIPLIMKLFAKMGWEQQFDKFEKLL